MLKMLAAGLTDIGKHRKVNQDALLVEPNYGVLAVADGMGGHNGGEVASRIVIDTLRDRFVSKVAPFTSSAVTSAIESAHRCVYKAGDADRALRGMGSTVVTLRLRPETHRIVIGHMGDSRCYRIRQGRIKLLTEDHSLIVLYAKQTGVSVKALANQGMSASTIYKACGVRSLSDETPEIHAYQAQVHDVYVLCSDGISGEISDAEILGLTLARPGVGGAAQRLVGAALNAGGRDNATVIVCELVDSKA